MNEQTFKGSMLMLLGLAGAAVGWASFGVTGSGATPGIVGFWCGPIVFFRGLFVFLNRNFR